LLALFAAGAAAQVFGPMLTQGGTLDAAAAEQLETSFQSNPRDVYARARLLGFYSAHAAQDHAHAGSTPPPDRMASFGTNPIPYCCATG